jgi:hypothetical protein
LPDQLRTLDAPHAPYRVHVAAALNDLVLLCDARTAG